MDAIAEEIAGDDWFHEPWYQRRHRKDYHDYTTVLGTTCDAGGYISNIWPNRPLHIIRLIASPPILNLDVIANATVIASWYPEGEDAWGVHVSYHTSLFARPRDVQFDNFSMYFMRRGETELILPGREYNGNRKFGDVVYYFGVSESPAADRDIRPYIESPESMRDHAIEVIQYLKERLEKQIPTGSAIRSLADPKLPQYHEDEGPAAGSLRAPFPQPYQLTAAQRDEVLKQAFGDLNERARLWRENYRELYAAANKAFPLKRLFAAEVDRRGYRATGSAGQR